MGYFGKSITASDTYMDFEHELLHFLGWRDNDSEDYKPHTERVGKEAFEGRVDEISKWMYDSKMTYEHGTFLAYHLLIRGVDVSNERLDKLITMFMDDEWAKNNSERRIYMNLAIEALEKYKTDKTPVDIDIEYDFNNYYILKHTDPKTSSEREIVDFFEKHAGIKIKYTLRSRYELYLVVSHEEFEAIKGESIMGIKFITFTE